MNQARRITRFCKLVLILLQLSACGVPPPESEGPRKPPVPVHTVLVEKSSVPHTLSTTGTVVCLDRRIISAGVEGPLEEISVLPGEEVQKGSVIAEIGTSFLEMEKRRLSEKGKQLQNDLQRAKKSARELLEAAERRLMEKERMVLLRRRNERVLEKARSELAAAEKIHTAGGIPESSLEEARSAVISAEEQVQDIRIRIASAEIGLRDRDFRAAGRSVPEKSGDRENTFLSLTRENAHIEVNHVERQIADHRLVLESLDRQLKLCTIRSPEHGFITTIGTTEGSYLKKGDPICSLIDPSQLYLRARISESDLSGLRNGMSLHYSLPHEEGRWRGQIRHVFPRIDRQSKSIPLLCTIDNPMPELRPGEYVEIEIELAPPEQLFTLPVLSLAGEERGTHGTVFSVKDGLAFATTLEIEERRGDSLFFHRGLEPSAEVIVNPPEVLRDGTPVSIIQEEQNVPMGFSDKNAKETPDAQ